MLTPCLDEDFAIAFAQGSLSLEDTTRAEQHLDTCNECQELVAILAQLGTVDGTDTVVRESPKVRPGDRIGRYSILEAIGSGATSIVYKAYDPELERDIALKLMRVAIDGSSDPMRATRLVQEARTLAQLSHENIVTVHEVGSHEQSVFIAMELVAGQTLRDWSSEDSHALTEILDVFVQVANGLQAAHDTGLVHRDLKPENVMIGHDGRVKVTDFGLALTGEEAMGASTSSKHVAGTPAYMAPEQWHGRADARSDQFSFFVSLFEALHGDLPFHGETISDLQRKVNSGKPMASLKPRWLGKLVAKGLSKEPDKRFASLSEFVSAVQSRRALGSRVLVGVVGTSVVLGAAVITGSFLQSDSVEPQCREQGQAMREVWNDSIRDELRTSMLGRSDAFAPAAWRQIEKHLDIHSSEWAAVSTELCVQESYSNSNPLYLKMQSCLDESLVATAALLRTMTSESNAPSSGTSVKAIARLARPQLCMKGSFVVGRRTNENRQPAVMRQLADAQALYDTRKYKAASAELPKLMTRAQEVGDQESLAGAYLLSCGVHTKLGQKEEAETACHEAAILSSGLGHPGQAARAWALLAGIVGGQAKRFSEAKRWTRYAQAASEQSPSLETEAILNNHFGVAAKQQGRHTEARENYVRAIKLFETIYGPNDLRVASVLNNLAILEGIVGDQEDAIVHHERALEIKEEQLGPNHPDVAVSLMNSALLHSQARPDKARRLYERALGIVENSLAGDHPVRAVLLSNLANLDRRSGQYQQAIDRLAIARTIFETRYGLENARVAAVIENEALVVARLGSPEKALVAHRRALQIREGLYDGAHADIANSLNNIAILLRKLGETQEALAVYERALRVRRLALGQEHVDTALDLLGVGSSRYELGMIKRSRAPLEQALDLVETSDAVDMELKASIEFQLAKTLRSSEYERAQNLAQSAMQHFQMLPGDTGADSVVQITTWLSQ